MSRRSSIDSAALAPLLARPQGVTVIEGRAATGAKNKALRHHLMRLVAYGKAWHGILAGERAYRYFCSAQSRDAACAISGPVPAPAQSAAGGHRRRAMSDIIDALLARPQGLTSAEGCDACPATGLRVMCKRLQHLVVYGRAWNVKVPGSLAHRWFGTQAARDAWAAANLPKPTRDELGRLKQVAKGPTMKDRLIALVHERGIHGTLPSDMAEAIGRPSGIVGSWVTDMQQRGLLASVTYKGVRIVHPPDITLTPGAVQACQRRLDRAFALRSQRGKYTLHLVAGKPGLPAGVTLPAKADWRHAPASNAGEVKITVCPAPKFDHRYQVDPALKIVGGFVTLGHGQYDMPASNAVAQVLARGRAA